MGEIHSDNVQTSFSQFNQNVHVVGFGPMVPIIEDLLKYLDGTVSTLKLDNQDKDE